MQPDRRLIVTVDLNLVRWMIRGLLVTATILISWLALTPSPPEVAVIGWDKANHALAFFVLAGLAQYSVVERDLYMWGGLAAYGVGIEIVQWLGGYRVFELTDIVADLVGIGLFVLISPLLVRLPILKSLKQFERRELL